MADDRAEVSQRAAYLELKERASKQKNAIWEAYTGGDKLADASIQTVDRHDAPTVSFCSRRLKLKSFRMLGISERGGGRGRYTP
jgi:hypothetical protein